MTQTDSGISRRGEEGLSPAWDRVAADVTAFLIARTLRVPWLGAMVSAHASEMARFVDSSIEEATRCFEHAPPIGKNTCSAECGCATDTLLLVCVWRHCQLTGQSYGRRGTELVTEFHEYLKGRS